MLREKPTGDYKSCSRVTGFLCKFSATASLENPRVRWRKFDRLIVWTDKNIPIVELKHAFK